MEYTYVTSRKLRRNFNELNFGRRKLGPSTVRKNNRKVTKGRGINLVPDELIKRDLNWKKQKIRVWNNHFAPKKQIKIYRWH
jgi:hypothetical protein